jgi:hypothetical protein
MPPLLPVPSHRDAERITVYRDAFRIYLGRAAGLWSNHDAAASAGTHIVDHGIGDAQLAGAVRLKFDPGQVAIIVVGEDATHDVQMFTGIELDPTDSVHMQSFNRNHVAGSGCYNKYEVTI